MTYQRNTLRIFKGSVQLKKIPGIRVLQVFDTEFKFENFYGSSNFTFNGFGKCAKTSPVFYIFIDPCVGVLWVGIGIAQYVQEGVRPEVYGMSKKKNIYIYIYKFFLKCIYININVTVETYT